MSEEDSRDEEFDAPEEEERYDEELEETFDEVERHGKKRKRLKSYDQVSTFFDTEAVEEESDEEEEEEYEEDGFVERVSASETASASDYRRRSNFPIFEGEIDEKALEDRYRGFYDEDESESGRRLPTVRDPKLWLVKCKIGKERLTVLSLLQKYFNTKNTSDKILIKSAIAPDHLKGFIYVEAEKQVHVEKAIKGLHNLQQFGLQLVPTTDMVDVLTTTRKRGAFKKGDWVRIKRGTYAGDLAQVFDIEESKGRITIKLVPRLDYSEKALEEKGPKKKGIRPSPKFFNAEEARALDSTNFKENRDGTFLWKGNRFKDGYLIKTMNLKSINFVNVSPALQELQKFQSSPSESGSSNKEDGESIPVVPVSQLRKAAFSKGDTVKVIEGDLKNLMGVIEAIDGDTITIKPKHELLKDLLKIPASQLQKCFKIGDHIKVVSGRYESETGFIMKLEGNTATVFSDLSNQEIKVLIQDVQECAEITSGKMSLGNYDLYDLIQINALVVGVIVKIERDSFKVLDNNSNLCTISLQEAGRKRNSKDATSFDAHSNPITIGDVVQVIDGEYKGKQGTIKHIFKYFAFLQSKQIFENGGIFVVRTGNCVILGGTKPKPLTPGNGPMLPQSPRHYSTGFQKSGSAGRNLSPSSSPLRSGGGRRQQHDLMDKSVIILAGPYKGYIGIVKNITKTNARVELHTNCKTVTVPIDILKNKEESSADFGITRRPALGDSRTYSEGSQTPYHSASTPFHSISTPVHGTAWDPNMPNTPMRHSTPNWNNESSYSGWGGSSNDWSQFPNYTPAIPPSSMGISHSGQDQPITPNFTPGTSFSDLRTPQQPISTPVGSYDTPSFTPGDGITTPGQDVTPADLEEPIDKEWQTKDILVKITDGPYSNAEGVIKDVGGSSCNVLIRSTKEMVIIPHHQLEPVPPSKKYEFVKIIRGSLKGKQGSLYGIEGGEAIVKMSTDLDIKILELKSLAIHVQDDKD